MHLITCYFQVKNSFNLQNPVHYIVNTFSQQSLVRIDNTWIRWHNVHKPLGPCCSIWQPRHTWGSFKLKFRFT